jgi:hypothetical protein
MYNLKYISLGQFKNSFCSDVQLEIYFIRSVAFNLFGFRILLYSLKVIEDSKKLLLISIIVYNIRN